MKRYLKILTISLAALMITACSNGANQTGASSTNGTATSQTSRSQTEENAHQIIVTINGQDYRASLNNSQASQSIIEQLPLNQNFRDFASGFDEKITDLEQTVEYREGETSNDPQAGDIAYWSPNNRIVFYWGDVGAYNGINVIGHFEDSSAVEAIRNLSDSDEVSIRLAD